MRGLAIILALALAACSALNPTAPTKQAVIIAFTADSYSLALGASTTLRWDVQGTSTLTCRIDPFLGNVPAVGFTLVQPFTTTLYSLTCSIDGLSPVVRLITVKVG